MTLQRDTGRDDSIWTKNAGSAEVEANAPKSPVFPLPLRSHLRPYSPPRPFSEWGTIHS